MRENLEVSNRSPWSIESKLAVLEAKITSLASLHLNLVPTTEDHSTEGAMSKQEKAQTQASVVDKGKVKLIKEDDMFAFDGGAEYEEYIPSHVEPKDVIREAEDDLKK